MKLFFRTFPFLFILLYSFITTGCTSSRSSISTEPKDIVGNWELYNQSGTIQDVCENEIIIFTKDGKATLQCPDGKPITRLYTARDGILTYTETGVQFKFNIKSDDKLTILELYGQNVGRNLFYKKVSNSRVKTVLKK